MPESFFETIRGRLAQVRVAESRAIDIKVTQQGQVILNGQVGSLDEKLDFSRALIGMPGCRCVQNQLAVSVARQPSFPVMTASAPPVPAANVPPAPAPEASSPEGIKTIAAPPQTLPPAPTETPAPTVSVPAAQAYHVPQLPKTPVAPARGTLAREIAQAKASEQAKAVTPGEKENRNYLPDLIPARVTPDDMPPQTTPTPRVKAPPPAQPVAPPNGRVQAAIKTKIKAVLGKVGRDVDLQFDGKGGVRVTMTVTKQADLKHLNALITQIVEIPELAGYEPSFQCNIQ
jgi:hypothetical protein